MLSSLADNRIFQQMNLFGECLAGNSTFPFYDSFKKFRDLTAKKGCHVLNLKIPSCRHLFLNELAEEIGGFDFNSVVAKKQQDIDLPSYVP